MPKPNSSNLNTDLIYPLYREIKSAIPDTLIRYDSKAVAAVMESGSPAQKVAMPWAWAMTVGDEVRIGVNATRIGTRLAAEGLPAIRDSLGPYTRLLTTMLQQELGEEVLTSDKGMRTMEVFDAPVLSVPEARPEHAARVHQAAHACGMDVAQLHGKILMRVLN